MGQIVNDIEIKDRLYDPYIDLYAIFGRTVEKSTKPFTVAWQRPSKRGALIQPSAYKSKKSALEAFNAAANGHNFPDRFTLRDSLAQKVYAWERAHVDPYSQDLSRKSIKELIKRVCHDYNIEPPKISFIKKGGHSWYCTTDHRIYLIENLNITALHETAHAIIHADCQEQDREYENHCSQFVWTLIDLYRDYADFDNQHLTATALKENLLGDVDARFFTSEP